MTGRGGKGRELLQRGQFTRVVWPTPEAPPPLDFGTSIDTALRSCKYNCRRNLTSRLAGANTAISGWNLQPLSFDANSYKRLSNARNQFCLIKIV